MGNEINIKITPLTGLKGAYKYKEDDISIVAYYIPRSLISNGIKFPYKELSYSSIYFLCGQEEFTEKVYVGQARTRNDGTSVISRLHEHDKNTNEHYHLVWDSAIVVTSTEGSWNSADISDLEQAFESIIPEENCLNSKRPSSGSADKSKTHTRVEYIKSCLINMGINVFEDDSNIGGELTEEYDDTNGNVEDIRGGTSKIPEIITPIKIVKRMILELKPETWNSNTKFIDLACKGGEYLREIYEQLMKNDNLIADYPDPTSRSVHILKNQIYGIALSTASRERAVRRLFNFDNNILIVPEYVVNIKDQNKRSDLIKKIKQIFGDLDMKFDVVIGNPPYSEETKAGKNGSVAIWNSFVETAIEVKPRCICMITPSRHFTGGMGLTKFRKRWLSDIRIAKLVHFPVGEEVFHGTRIAGGGGKLLCLGCKKKVQ